MNRTIKMDRSGRVIIPQVIRVRYGIDGGSHRLEVHESPDGIVLRPVAEEIPAERDRSGWVVFRSADEESVDPSEAVGEARERRHRQVRGDG